jgi:hypothetical protein
MTAFGARMSMSATHSGTRVASKRFHFLDSVSRPRLARVVNSSGGPGADLNMMLMTLTMTRRAGH